MATLTVYPDAHPESTSVDGIVNHQDNESEWSTLRDGAGTYQDDDDDKDYIVHMECGFTTDKYDVCGRGIFVFDISAIPGGASIISVVFSVWISGAFNYLTSWPDAKVNIYSAAPTSNTELAAGDFNSLGTTPFCDTNIDWVDMPDEGGNPEGWINFTLNTAGLVALATAIAGDGILKLGTREVTYDVGDTVPTWVSSGEIRVTGELAETALGASYKPKLVITYNVAMTVTTQAVTVIAAHTATGNGNITGLGIPIATQYGVCWNTAGSPTTADSKTEEGPPAVTGAFTSSITGLTKGTTYYVKAYATNDAGTVYGGEVTFVAAGEKTIGTIWLESTKLHKIDEDSSERSVEGTLV